MRWHEVWEVVKRTGQEFMADKAMRLGAALSFYTALSLAPLLLVVIGIAGLVFGPDAARGELAAQLKGLIGEDGANTVQEMLAKNTTTGGGVLSTVAGAVTLLVGATGVFGSLQDALDTVWNVKTDQTPSGIWAMVKDRLLSFSMVCGMAFLLLVSLVLTAVLTALGGAVERWLPGGGIWLQLGNLLVGFLVTAAMFALIFKVLPHARPAWSDVWVGALLTAGLFTLGKYLIGLYLGTMSVGSAYGAAGSFVVLLFWIYYSSLIVLFGAEFTQVYALRHGSGLKAVEGLTPADPHNRTGAGAPAPPPAPRPAVSPA
ncbi:MAG: YihY/virulence factor BrkB family protein [Gemmataceae bacterium]|nr:YihY/virulence factor BrkB family protein [Gemmataceae bacterium]